jgi:threonine/homoserine/homoserine lactone efflux protein
MTGRLALFAALAGLIEVTPGPDTFLVLRMTMRSGRLAGMWAGCGAATGIMAWAGLAALGLAAILQHSSWGYPVLRLLGAAMLLYLGISSLFGPHGGHQIRHLSGPVRATALRSYGYGLASAATNPANGLLYLALVPEFLIPGYPPAALILVLGAIDALIAVGWQSLVATSAGRLSLRLARPSVTKGLERTAGLVLTGFGLLALMRI